MPGEPGEGRRRKLTGGSDRRFGEWAETASDQDYELVSEVLMAVVEDTWTERYRGYVDPTHGMRFHIEPRPGLIVSVQYAHEYPGFVQVVFIGEPHDS